MAVGTSRTHKTEFDAQMACALQPTHGGADVTFPTVTFMRPGHTAPELSAGIDMCRAFRAQWPQVATENLTRGQQCESQLMLVDSHFLLNSHVWLGPNNGE